jgi:hypothetical protein
MRVLKRFALPVVTAVVALTAGASPALASMAAPPASASGNHLCETSGNYCIGAPSLATDAPVVETSSGRDITLEFLGSAQYELQFNDAPSECVAAANNGTDVVIHHCNGGDGVVWILFLNANGHLQWQNREFSGDYLAGHNDASQYQVKAPGLSGWFYNFDQT